MKLIFLYLATLVFQGELVLDAQSVNPPTKSERASCDSAEPWSYHFQFTVIQQEHGKFSAPYSGMNSLQDTSENHYSVTATLFVGRKLWQGGEVYLNPELSGGSGFSLTRGVAGFPNGEVYRVDDPSPKVTMARLFLRQRFSLGSREEVETVEADQNQLACSIPKSQLTLTAGKFSLTDIFDRNAFSHDPRTQFMNWSLWAPGAWDYAADTRGYTWGIAAELHQPTWSLNFAAVLMPSFANGPNFDLNIHEAYSFNLELVKSYSLLEQKCHVHLIGFLNHAHMGNYRTAINDAAASGTTPDITTTREYSSKYGFALCLEQPLSETVGFFSRYSWDDGKTETFAFTEIDQSFHAGLNIRGNSWNRTDDNLGIAFVSNSLSDDHRDYLAAGGYGYLVGDGKLNYAPEVIIETSYSLSFAEFHLWMTPDYQFVLHPAYNGDRGPVHIFGIRAHVAF